MPSYVLFVGVEEEVVEATAAAEEKRRGEASSPWSGGLGWKKTRTYKKERGTLQKEKNKTELTL